jgi:uncharacterized protein
LGLKHYFLPGATMERILQDYTPKDLKVFHDEWKDFLPEKIIDFHIHLWKRSFLEDVDKDRRRIQPFYDADVFAGFSANDYDLLTQKLFPDKKVQGLFFGLPLKEVQADLTNAYIAEVCDQKKCFGLFIPAPGQKEIPHDFFEKRFIGFKPYPDLAFSSRGADISKLDIDIGLFDFISESVLDFSNTYGLFILIHLPRKERLNSKANIEEIRTISKKYPAIKIILAHAGRSYCYWDIKDSIGSIKDIQNLYVDTAMVNSASVMRLLLEELGPDRILYGSDLPVAAIKGKNIDVNNKHYFVTSKPRPWSLSSSVMDLGSFTFFVYETIRAIKAAIESLGMPREAVEKIFYGNARRLTDAVLENIT